MKPQLVRCGFGLGNRVAAIAHALCMFERVRFVWRINHECPAHHEDVFPNGIPNVEFDMDAPLGFASQFGDKRIHEWQPDLDAQKRKDAYQTVIDSMAGDAKEEFRFSAIARLRRFQINAQDAADEIAWRAKNIGADSCFLLADSNRAEIAERLAENGIKTTLPDSPEMEHDFDRNAASVIQFCSDWKTALAADILFSVGGDSSLAFPKIAGIDNPAPIPY